MPCFLAVPRRCGPVSRQGILRAAAAAVAIAALAALMVGCADGGERARVAGAVGGGGEPSVGPAMAETPEAVSFLGRPLYRLPGDSATRERLEAQLDSAEAIVEVRPEDADAVIWYGRRLAYTGRYRDAIDAFTDGIRSHPDDPRFYRHRGHRYITVRELDRAVEDLAHAARLVSGQRDVVEPDGMPNAAGIPRSTLRTNIWYHLGLARFLQGDFFGAAYSFRAGLAASPNDDMRVAMADWLWMSLTRLGHHQEADRSIAFVEPEMDILENDAYHRRLLVYRGILPADSIAPAAIRGQRGDAGEVGGDAAEPEGGVEPDEEEALRLATYGYGLGHWYLVNGDSARARRVFEAVLETGYWPAFGYIAAEAELARWNDDGGTP